MALATRFIPHSIYLKTGSFDTWIDAIESYAPDQGVSLFEESGGSSTDREYVASRSVEPVMPIATKDLSFLSACGFSGLFVVPASGKAGLTAYGRELPLGGLPTAVGTGNHLKCLVSDGLLVPVSIGASHNSIAKLNLMLHCTLGTTPTYSQAAPMLFSNSNAITSGAGAVTKVWTTGPVKFNSTLVQGITDLSVDFGIQVLKESDSGDVYPSEVAIIGRTSKIMFTTKDLTLIAAIADGLSISTFAAYFRKVNQNGQRVAAATAEHIGISATAGMIVPGATGLQHRTPGSTAYTFVPSYNSALITISTTAQIPTS